MNPLRILFFAALASGLLWAVGFVVLYGWRRRTPPGLQVAAAVSLTCGLASGLLGGAHLVGVVRQALAGRGVAGAAVFVYDFRFYSLVLVGLLIAVPGFLCLVHARGLVRSERSAWKQTIWFSLVLVGVNAPLIPLQGFAPLLAGLAGANLLGLMASRRQFLRPSP